MTTTTVDFETWLESLEPLAISTLSFIVPAIDDFEGASTIKFLFSGFMILPVAMHEGKSLCTKNAKFQSYHDIITFFSLPGEKFLHRFLWQGGFPVYQIENSETGLPQSLAEPDIMAGHWSVNYAEFERND